MNTLIGYKKCSTCKNIEKLLEEKNISYDYREIDKDLLSVDELKKIKNL
ncbi:MAG: arsenate reductase family protein, partial [Peptoniphilus harei]|nr:arsenate reductase family protein [Peptoniphilus harei]